MGWREAGFDLGLLHYSQVRCHGATWYWDLQTIGSFPLYLAALDALGGELVLVALGAVDVVLLGDEGLRS